MPGWAQPCRSPPPADIIFQPLDSWSLLKGQCRVVTGEPGRGAAAARGEPAVAAGRRSPGGAGGSGSSAPEAARSLSASVRGIPSPRRAGARGQSRLPPALSPGRRRAPRAKGAERAEQNSVEVLAVRRPRWQTMALELEAVRCWVRGTLGAWARKRRIPHPAAWQPSGFNCGPEERGRDPAIAADAYCTGIFLQDTCLVLRFAFYNQLTRCT